MRTATVVFSFLLVGLLAAEGASADVPVSSIEYGQADYSQTVAAIASTGDLALVVWNEATFDGVRWGFRAFAARVAAPADVRERLPISLGDRQAVGAAWSGEHFLVALGGSTDSRLLVLGVDGVVVRELGFERGIQGVSCGTTVCLATFLVSRANALTVDIVMIDRSGQVRAPAQTIAQVGRSSSIFSAASGDGFLVAWHDTLAAGAGVWRVVAVDDDGRAAVPQTVTGFTGVAALSGDRDGYLLAGEVGGRIAFQRLTKAGALDGAPEKPELASWPARTNLVPVEGGFLTVLAESYGQRRLLAAPLSRRGAMLGNVPSLGSGASGGVAAAALGAGVLVVSSEVEFPPNNFRLSKYDDLVGRIVSPSGQLADDAFRIATSARPQREPVALMNDGRLFSAWTEEVNGVQQVRTSTLRDASDLLTEWSAGPSDVDQFNPAVAFNGREYLVAWTEATGAVFARRFTADGMPIDTAPLTIAQGAAPYADYGGWHPAPASPFVASDGGDFAVVWSEPYDVEGRTFRPLRAVMARVAGNTISEKRVVSREENASAAGIVWDGAQYVVLVQANPKVYALCDPVSCISTELYVSRVRPDGTLATTADLRVSENGLRTNVQMIRSASGTMVAWSGWRGISAIAISQEGQPTREMVLAGSALSAAPRIASVGSQVFLTWLTGTSLVGTFVSPDASSAGQPHPLANGSPTDRWGAPVVDLGGGRIAIVYETQVDDAEHGRARRVFVGKRTVAAPRQRAVGRR